MKHKILALGFLLLLSPMAKAAMPGDAIPKAFFGEGDVFYTNRDQKVRNECGKFMDVTVHGSLLDYFSEYNRLKRILAKVPSIRQLVIDKTETANKSAHEAMDACKKLETQFGNSDAIKDFNAKMKKLTEDKGVADEADDEFIAVSGAVVKKLEAKGIRQMDNAIGCADRLKYFIAEHQRYMKENLEWIKRFGATCEKAAKGGKD